jgi:hypothetical protein
MRPTIPQPRALKLRSKPPLRRGLLRRPPCARKGIRFTTGLSRTTTGLGPKWTDVFGLFPQVGYESDQSGMWIMDHFLMILFRHANRTSPD